MITGSLLGDLQYAKTLILGDYKFIKYVNIKYKENIYTFPILHSQSFFDKTLKEIDAPNCVLICSPLKYIFLKNGNNNAFICNDNFINELSDDEKNAVYMHEFGHFIYRHREEKYDENNIDVYLKHELEADSFACKKGYGKHILSLLENLKKKHIDIQSIDKRILNARNILENNKI